MVSIFTYNTRVLYIHTYFSIRQVKLRIFVNILKNSRNFRLKRIVHVIYTYV